METCLDASEPAEAFDTGWPGIGIVKLCDRTSWRRGGKVLLESQ